jgi:hypothetical protein
VSPLDSSLWAWQARARRRVESEAACCAQRPTSISRFTGSSTLPCGGVSKGVQPRRFLARAPRAGALRASPRLTTRPAGLRRCSWQIAPAQPRCPRDTKATGGVVGLTVLQPKFLEQFPNARFHFNSDRLAQQGTFKGVWLNEEHTEWALEEEQQ